MTYLQLCQTLRREANITGTGPSAVTNQSGKYLDVVEWVKQAWVAIQGRHPNWRWMRRPFTLNTAAGTAGYAPTSATDVDASAAISRFGHWWALDPEDPPRCYLQSGGVAGEYRLTYMPWDGFKWVYGIGTQNNGKPAHVSVDQKNHLHLGPKPDAVYVVSGDFQRGPQVLAADLDTPEMPAQFHDLVWQEALRRYAGDEAAPESMSRAITEGNRLQRQLELNQLPAMTFGNPLA